MCIAVHSFDIYVLYKPKTSKWTTPTEHGPKEESKKSINAYGENAHCTHTIIFTLLHIFFSMLDHHTLCAAIYMKYYIYVCMVTHDVIIAQWCGYSFEWSSSSALALQYIYIWSSYSTILNIYCHSRALAYEILIIMITQNDETTTNNRKQQSIWHNHRLPHIYADLCTVRTLHIMLNNIECKWHEKAKETYIDTRIHIWVWVIRLY